MSILVKLNPTTGGLVAETTNGLEVQLPLSREAAANALVRMLRVQAEHKPVPRPPGYNQNWNYVLAEWERIGPTGAGKVPKPHRLPDDPRKGADPYGIRRFTPGAKGKLAPFDPLADDIAAITEGE
jgi:hypothetical protein